MPQTKRRPLAGPSKVLQCTNQKKFPSANHSSKSNSNFNTADEKICSQVQRIEESLCTNGRLRGTDGTDTFYLPMRLRERMSCPSPAAAGRTNPDYSAVALLVYLMNASIFELRKPESKRHHQDFLPFRPKEIAARLGCSTDTIYRAMRRLKLRGILWLDSDRKIRFDLLKLWSLCVWKPESEKPSMAKAEILGRIDFMKSETSKDILAGEQARCISVILNAGSSVELPLSLVDGPVEDGRHPIWSAIDAYAYFVYKFTPWHDWDNGEWRQHFQGGMLQIHRSQLRKEFRCGDTKITKRIGQLVEDGYLHRLVTKGTRPLNAGEDPLIWKEEERHYRLLTRSAVTLDADRYLAECHVRRVPHASSLAERRTSRLAKPHQNSRWKSRHEVPMPQEGTLTEENVAEYLDKISLRHNKDAGRKQELAEKVQAAMSGFGLTPQRLGELYALYINNQGLWYQRADGATEPIRYAAKWLDDREGLAKTLAWAKDNRMRIERQKTEALSTEEIWKRSKLKLVSDAFRSWWIYSPDPGTVSFESVDGSDDIESEEDARRLLGYQFGVLAFEDVADLF